MSHPPIPFEIHADGSVQVVNVLIKYVHSPDQTIRGAHKQVLNRDLPVMWINPVEETIGWLAHATEARPANSEDSGACEVRFCGLDDLDLLGTGLFPPGYLRLRDAWREEQRERDEEKRQNERHVREIVHGARAPTLRPVTAVADGRKRCHRCGGPLDPILEDAGAHFGEDCANRHW